MMTIVVNGARTEVDASTTLVDVVRSFGVDEDAAGVAVAVNDAVVPKRDWRTRRIAAGDAVEIIRAVQGG
jgi:sulfur carrier protein